MPGADAAVAERRRAALAEIERLQLQAAYVADAFLASCVAAHVEAVSGEVQGLESAMEGAAARIADKKSKQGDKDEATAMKSEMEPQLQLDTIRQEKLRVRPTGTAQRHTARPLSAPAAAGGVLPGLGAGGPDGTTVAGVQPEWRGGGAG